MADEHRAYGQVFKDALPDAHMEIESTVEGGDWVAVRARFRGTHSRPLRTPQGEIPASGNALDLPFADFFRVEDGKAIEHYVYYDVMSMMGQLGALPETGR
jgi:predicted ester cyclase